MGRKLDANVEPRFLPFLGGNWLALVNQAIEVEGRHRLQAIQRLRDVYPEVGNLKRWDFRDHACSLRIARERDLILQDRLPAHGSDLLVIFAGGDSNMPRDPFTALCAWRIEPSGIQSNTRALWSRAQIVARAHWRGQACGLPRHLPEVHHIRKRAQGGSDFDRDRLVALCRPCCHAQTDAPYARGRLVITPLGQGRACCEIMHGADKRATRA